MAIQCRSTGSKEVGVTLLHPVVKAMHTQQQGQATSLLSTHWHHQICQRYHPLQKPDNGRSTLRLPLLRGKPRHPRIRDHSALSTFDRIRIPEFVTSLRTRPSRLPLCCCSVTVALADAPTRICFWTGLYSEASLIAFAWDEQDRGMLSISLQQLTDHSRTNRNTSASQ